MYALAGGEVKIDRNISSNLLLELSIYSVYPGISIILAEHPNGSKRWKAAGWWHVHNVGPYRHWQAATAEGRSARYAKLLHAVIGDRANLRQHVLASVIDAGVG